MTETLTTCGRLLVGPKEKLFAHAAALVAESHARATVGHAGECHPMGDTVAAPNFVCALSGGATPQDWYRWCVATRALPADVTAATHFTVSDERHVPLTDAQSNFGQADRLLLTPLAVPPAHRHPWPVTLPPAQAAASYRAAIVSLVGASRAYEICFLGLGDDGHTASLFPGSPLLRDDGGEPFAAIEVPGKGGPASHSLGGSWRLTITPAGLRACGQIVVLALGANKAATLARVLRGAHEPLTFPAQILQSCAPRVLWLVDEAAAARL